MLLCLAWASQALAAGQTWREISQQGNFSVELEASDGKTGLSEFQTWQLTIRDASSDEDVTPVRVVVGGGMPAHGHGLPTQPQVTEYLGGGRYKLEGLMFNMAGEWQLIFEITTGRVTDRVVFDLSIEH